MVATYATWVSTTRRHLLSGGYSQRNVLAAPYTAAGGTLSLTNAIDGIVPGGRLSIGTNVFYVVAVNNAGLQATVIGGQEGSTDANAASGALVWVNPRFTDFEIVEALNADLTDLSAPDNGLFQVVPIDLPYVAPVLSYALPGLTDLDYIDSFEVRYLPATTNAQWTPVEKHLWRVDRSAGLLAGPVLELALPLTTGSTIRLLTRVGFDTFDVTSANLASTGLPTTAWDIPPIGAAMRLMVPREVKRNQLEAQGDTRRASEVPPGAVLGSARALAAWRAQRVAAEAARLTAQYPDKRW